MATLSRARYVPRLTLVATLVVCAAAVLPYVSTLGSYFIGDDFGLIQLLSQKPPLHFLTLFASPWTETIYGERADELRPLLALSYQFDSLWGSASPFGYHVTSIVLHALNALLVLTIARVVGRLTLPASVFTGTVFAVLPIHAETVAWISGRADSMPTLFYLSSFLAYAMWRRTSAAWLYWSSVAVFFLALFSKQSMITMVATLVLFDALAEGRRPRPFWLALRPYLPFLILTAGYLILRYVLFGNAVREHTVGARTLLSFARVQAVHLELLALGSEVFPYTRSMGALASAMVALALLPVIAELRDVWRGRSHTIRGRLLYFGPVWWLVSTMPLLVTYISPRHLYLASAGVVVALGVALDALCGARRHVWLYVGVLGASALIMAYTLRLGVAVAEWNTSATISQKMSADVERQASAIPAGSLLVLGTQRQRAAHGMVTWLWGYALPFALQSPFTPSDVTRRAFIIAPPRLWCCAERPDGSLDEWWSVETRRTIGAWSGQVEPRPVITLLWDSSTGAMVRRSEQEYPALRGQVLGLLDAETTPEMCTRLRDMLDSVRELVYVSC